MKSLLLFVFLVLALALVLATRSHEYAFDKPPVGFQGERFPHKAQTAKASGYGTQIIKGNNGKSYEVTMSASRKIYETRLHLPPREQVFLVQHLSQPTVGTAPHHSQQPPAYAQTVIPVPENVEFNGNSQHSLNIQEQNFKLNSNLHYDAFAANNEQTYNQFTATSRHPPHQQQVTRTQQQEQTAVFSLRAQQQQQQDISFSQSATQHQQQIAALPQTVQQQQQFYLQPYEHYLQQPLHNNHLPNSNNLLNDLVNKQQYVSQSETAQLDAYPYKQLNGNPRPFTRIISKCDVSGQCEPQNAAGDGGSGGMDFHHQQVLKQSKAKVEPNTDKFNQFGGNVLTNGKATAQKGAINIYKGTDLKDRRLFPYSEIFISEYPHN